MHRTMILPVRAVMVRKMVAISHVSHVSVCVSPLREVAMANVLSMVVDAQVTTKEQVMAALCPKALAQG